MTLIIGDTTRRVELKADSNHDNAYCLLSLLYEALETFRKNRLQALYQQGEQIIFQLQNSRSFLALQKETITINHLQRDSDCFEVLKIAQNSLGGELELVLEGTNRRIAVNRDGISDQLFFLSKAEKILDIQESQEPPRLRYIRQGAVVLLIIFGLNGWFKVYDGSRLFDIVSLFAGIILALKLICKPVFWLVDKWNTRRIIKAYQKR